MQKIKLFTAAILCLTSMLLNAQATVSAENLKQHVRYLADDKLRGRYTGSRGEKRAASYIISTLKATGITNVSGNMATGGYIQKFHYKVNDHGKTKIVKGRNIAGFIDNSAANTLILGAHYDHLGMGDPMHSMYRGAPAVHNGADDNASGVAAILELGRLLKASDLKGNNYLILAFSGEELGLYGSKWFTENPSVPLSKTNAMLNYDMVGRVDSNKIVIYGTGTSPVWREALNSAKSPLLIKQRESGVGPSDQTSFYLKNIPVLHFFSGQHKDYHKPDDDEDKINYTGMVDIINLSQHVIRSVETAGKIAFNKTKDDDPENTPKFKVTLGVMPDYTYSGEGMRIDGVTDGKPAAKAGLKEGDVVIQLGDIQVKDMTGYMKALAACKKGDTVPLKAQRGNEIFQTNVTF